MKNMNCLTKIYIWSMNMKSEQQPQREAQVTWKEWVEVVWSNSLEDTYLQGLYKETTI